MAGIIVEDVDGVPSYTDITTLRHDQADYLNVVQVSSTIAKMQRAEPLRRERRVAWFLRRDPDDESR